MNIADIELAPETLSPGSSIYFEDATELATLIRTKQASSREIVQAHLGRIAAVSRGKVLGPFHGVPFTIKDAIDTAGVLTQRGSRIFAGNMESGTHPGRI